MIWSNIQKKRGGDATGSLFNPVTVSFAAAVTAGSKVSGALMWENDFPGPTLTNVTDDKGNPYITLDPISDVGNGEGFVSFYATSFPNGLPTSIIANFSGTTAFWEMSIKEDNPGAGFAISLDGHTGQIRSVGAGVTGANVFSSGSITTTANGDLVDGFFIKSGGSPTLTAGTSPNAFTVRENADPTSSLSEDFVQTSSGSIATTFGQSNGTTVGTVIGGVFVLAFTAVASGATLVTGWQNNASDVYRAAPQKLSAAPAFVSPFRTAGISGSAWNAQRDHAKLPPRVVFVDAPAYGHPAFAVASTIAGIGWFEPPDAIKLPPRASFGFPPAFVSTFKTAPISGIAWSGPRDHVNLPKGGFLTDPVSINYNPLTITWSFSVGDTIFLRDPPNDAGLAFGRPPSAQAVGISGIAWFIPRDADVVAKARFLTDPVSIAYVPAKVTWSFSVVDVTPVRKTPFDAPPAFGQLVISQTVGISGIGWFEPPDVVRPTLKINGEAQPALSLTPATLPPKIAGMAWFEAPDRDKAPFKVTFDYPPAFGRSLTAPVNTIAGMAWFEASDRDRPAPRVNLDTPPALGPLPITISGMGWFQPPDRVGLVHAIRDEAPALVYGGVSPGVAFGWFVPTDWRVPGVRINAVAPALVLRKPAPPVGISGMAWFAPPDHDRAPYRATVEAAPAWAASVVIQIAPSRGIFAVLDVHGAMSFEEFNALAARSS